MFRAAAESPPSPEAGGGEAISPRHGVGETTSPRRGVGGETTSPRPGVVVRRRTVEELWRRCSPHPGYVSPLEGEDTIVGAEEVHPGEVEAIALRVAFYSRPWWRRIGERPPPDPLDGGVAR